MYVLYIHCIYYSVLSLASRAPKSDDHPRGSSSWKKGKITMDRKETDLEYQYPRTGEERKRARI